ncbi:lipoprotein [Phytoactinopolyspora mesophila]|uniref:DUF3558 domain-containing protein n=1 Tax=Phytoactinopolyspora mesophila TaxID=2650750 RepID=A0A7K3M462_9ACTN|nr:lipoprotein [Phytoactinopolyspora mesophila]NDL58104.1 hypothetical protein [Phytoactinopolyspora mesophila]
MLNRGTAALVVAIAYSISSCGGSAGDAAPAPTPVAPTTTPGDPFDEGATAAASSMSLTDSGACDLPLTFDLAAQWTAEAVPADSDFERGGFLPRCEIDAKPAGWIGYIRVWTGPGDDPQDALGFFLDGHPGEIEDAETRAVDVGGTAAEEIHYVYHLAALDERKRQRALALPVTDGMAIITVSGLDTEEYEGMLPAYILARETIQLTDG